METRRRRSGGGAVELTLQELIVERRWDAVKRRIDDWTRKSMVVSTRNITRMASKKKLVFESDNDEGWDDDDEEDLVNDTPECYKEWPDDEIRTVDKFGFLPLHQVCFHQPPIEVLQTLLDAFPEASSTLAGSLGGGGADSTTNTGQLPIHVAAFYGGPLNVLDLLCSAYPQGVEERAGKSGQLPLHSACAGSAQPDIVQCLLRAYPQAVRVFDFTGKLPLHHVVLSSSIASFRLIIEAWKDAASTPARKTVHTPGLGDHDTNTNYNDSDILPLHLACRRSDPSSEMIQTLLALAPKAAEVPDDMGRLPLHIICLFLRQQPKIEGQNSITQLIAATPRTGFLRRDCFGRIPLHLAWMDHQNTSAFLNVDLVRQLLIACPEALYVPQSGEEDDNYFFGESKQKTTTTRRIIDDIPDSPHFPDLSNFVRIISSPTTRKTAPGEHPPSPLHVACCHKAPTSIVQAMCDINPKDLVVPDDLKGRLPLHYAAFACVQQEVWDIMHPTLPKQPHQQRIRRDPHRQHLSSSLLSLLIQRNGATLFQPDNDGFLPFFLACFSLATPVAAATSSKTKPFKEMNPEWTESEEISNVESLYLLLRHGPDVLH